MARQDAPSEIQRTGIAYRSLGVQLLPAVRQLSVDAHTVDVENKVFDLIELLLAQHERALGKDEIIRHLWGRRPVTDAALAQLAYKARRAIGDEDRQLIRTVYGHGLQWGAPVEVVDESTKTATATSATDSSAATNTASTPRHARWWLGAALASLLILVVASMLWIDPARTTLQAPQFAVMPINNASGDASLEWTRFGFPALITTELERSGLSGVDPRQVESLVAQASATPHDTIDNVLVGSGAHSAIGGELQRVGDLLRLDLTMTHDGRHRDYSASGTAPAQLAVNLAAQIARDLRADSPRTHLPAKTQSSWLAETYARGMDLTARGEWQASRPYFELAVQQDPEFLEARLNLARVQLRTDQEVAGEKNLRQLLRESDPDSPDAIRARMELAMQHSRHGDRAAALRELEAVGDAAERSGIAALPAWIQMNQAQLHAELGHAQAADDAFAHAERIITTHGLRNFETRLYNVASNIAAVRGDLPGAIRANLRALDAANAIGDRGAAAAASINAAILNMQDGHLLDALPLLVQGWRDTHAETDQASAIYAGQNLVEATLQLGATNEAVNLLDQLQQRVEQVGLPDRLATQHALRGILAWRSGQPAKARREYAAIGDALQGIDLDIYMAEVIDLDALACWDLSDVVGLDALAAEAQRLRAHVPDPAQLALSETLIRALAAQQHGDAAQARKLIEQAGKTAGLARDSVSRDKFLSISLRVALAQSDAFARRQFDELAIDALENADPIALYREWAYQSGDADAVQRADERLQTLRVRAIDALHQVDSIGANDD